MKTRMPSTHIVLMFALLSIVPCGCGINRTDDNVSNIAQEQQLSLSIIYADGDAAGRQGVSKIIDDFERSHPNIKVNVINTETSSSTYVEFLKTKDAVGEFPDLMEMGDTQMFADAGLIAPLPDDIVSLFKYVSAVNGKVYNAPIVLPPPHGISYNKKIFRQAGITQEPKTLQEFMEDCDKIKASGISPLVIGGKDIWHLGFWTNKFLMDEVYGSNTDWNSQRTNVDVSWTDAGPKKAINELLALWKNGYVYQGFTTIADSQTAEYLTKEKAAMVYSGPWMFKEILQRDPKFELGFFALPDSNGVVTVAGLPYPNGWSMSSEAAKDPDKEEAIKQFLHFFYSKEEYSKFLETVNGIPATKEEMEYETIEPMKKALEIMRNPETRQSMYMNYFWGENRLPSGFRNWFYSAVIDLTEGKFTVDEMLRKADAEWDKDVQEDAEQVGSP